MKILFLNPHIDAGHQVAKALQARGLAVLFPADATEAKQVLQLHGTSIDLAIVHREGALPSELTAGLEFLRFVKSTPQHSDLPLILTSGQWGDAEFAEHQTTPEGVNAYLHWPFDENAILSMIDAVIGLPEVEAAAPVAMPAAPSDFVEVTGEGSKSGVVLEDASNLFSQPLYEASETSIRLDAPDVPDDQPSIPTAETGTTGTLSKITLEGPMVTPPVAQTSPAPEVAVPAPLEGIELSGIELSPEPSAPAVTDAPRAEDPSSIAIDLPESASGVSIPTAMHSLESQLVEPQSVAEMQTEGDDLQAASEMPYLFGGRSGAAAGIAFAQPLGDAVIPGGAAQSPDLETMKKYLLLREQDVAALSAQLKTAKDQIRSLEETLRTERGRNVELSHTVDEQRKKIEGFEREKAIEVESLQREIDEAKFQLKAKTDKARVMEIQVREATEEMERLKERVRQDIRKIRVREKELENRLEIMKKDSEALIGARENKIVELKRKLDLVEFNMDLLQDQYAREKERAALLKERLTKAAQVVRVAGGLLDENGNDTSSSQAA